MLLRLRSSPASKNARPGVILRTHGTTQRRAQCSEFNVVLEKATLGGTGAHSMTKPVATSIHAVSPPLMGILLGVCGLLLAAALLEA